MEGLMLADSRIIADYSLGDPSIPYTAVTVEIQAKFFDLDSATAFQEAVREILERT